MFSNLDHHITEDARQALSQARQAVDAEIDWKVRAILISLRTHIDTHDLTD